MQVGINKLENETQLGFINKWTDDPWFWLIDPGLLPRKVRACPFAVNHPEVGLKAWMNGVSLHSTWNKSMDWYSCFIHYLMGAVLGAVYIWHSQRLFWMFRCWGQKTNSSLARNLNKFLYLLAVWKSECVSKYIFLLSNSNSFNIEIGKLHIDRLSRHLLI